MSKFTKFEEIKVWKKARTLSYKIYFETRNDFFSHDYSLVKQIRRSPGSIMDNIAEGYERGGNKEFIHFLYISKGSSAEAKSQLYRALDQRYISQVTFNHLYDLINEISFMLGKLIKYLKESEYKGPKFNKIQNSERKPQNSEHKTQNS